MSFFAKKGPCGHVQPRNKNFKEHPSIHPIHPSIHPSAWLFQCQHVVGDESHLHFLPQGSDACATRHEKVKKCVKKNVYTSGGGPDMKKSKNVSKKNCLHFWGRVWHEKVRKCVKKNCLHFWGGGWHEKVRKCVKKKMFTLLGKGLKNYIIAV